MKTSFVRLFSVIVCVCLVLCLVSCNGKDDDRDTSDGDAVTVEDSTTADAETIPADAGTDTETTSEPETEAVTTFAPDREGIIHSDEFSSETPFAPVVLTYHLLEEEPFGDNTGMFLRPEEFEDHLRVLKEAGYEFMFADEYCYSSQKCVIITFDDGYVDNYTTLYPILQEYGVPATIFVITKLVDVRSDYLSSAMLLEMSNSGYLHIGSHTVNHDDMRDMPEDRVRSELRDSKAFLEAAVGRPVTAVSYPTGGFSQTVVSVAAEYYNFGYTTVQQKDTSKCSKLAISRLSTSRGEWGDAILDKIS